MLYFAIFLASVFVSSVSQILLKKSALLPAKSKIREYFNMRVIVAYGFFFLSMLATFIAYRGVDVSLGPILEATGYIYVAVLSVIFLKEKLNTKTIIGLSLILIGVFIFVFL